MYVCVCNAITDHEIRGAAELGVRTLDDLSASLGVATCCRRCTDCARQVLADAVEDRLRRRRLIGPRDGLILVFAPTDSVAAARLRCARLRRLSHTVGGGVMKGDPEVIRHLNAVLTNELTAINQYFLHARMFRHWGFTKLGEHEYHESIDEMKHADKLIARILFLEGLPNLQDLHKLLHRRERRRKRSSCDLQVRDGRASALKAAIAHCERVGDYVSASSSRTSSSPRKSTSTPRDAARAHRQGRACENYLQSQMGEAPSRLGGAVPRAV